MITVANRLYVKPEYADAFEKVFRERAGLVDKMEGFISNQILRPVNDGDPYVIFTTWNSRLDFLNGSLRRVCERSCSVRHLAERRVLPNKRLGAARGLTEFLASGL